MCVCACVYGVYALCVCCAFVVYAICLRCVCNMYAVCACVCAALCDVMLVLDVRMSVYVLICLYAYVFYVFFVFLC